MRKLVLKMEVSVDGFVGRPDGDVEWIFPSLDDEFREYEVNLLWGAGVHVMGRVTYGDMAEHWPASPEPFAPPMNEIPKVVFSRTLEEASWPDSSIARFAGHVDLKLESARTFPGGTVALTYTR